MSVFQSIIIKSVPVLVFTFFVVVIVAQVPGAAIRWWHKTHAHDAVAVHGDRGETPKSRR